MISISICASISFLEQVKELKQKLEAIGITDVKIPVDTKEAQDNPDLKREQNLIKRHYNKILDSDAILVANYEKNSKENYIGANTFLEMGFAHVNNKQIFLLNDTPSSSNFIDEIRAMSSIPLQGDITKIKEFYDKLPQVSLASQSPIKIRACVNAMQKANLKYTVKGFKAASNVNEQPFGLQETYQGAINRLNHLKQQQDHKQSEYYISVESGAIAFKADEEYSFDVAICVIENKNQEREIATSAGTNVPAHIVKEIKERDIELGQYIMENSKIKLKDPVQFFTHGRMKRSELITNAITLALNRFKN